MLSFILSSFYNEKVGKLYANLAEKTVSWLTNSKIGGASGYFLAKICKSATSRYNAGQFFSK
ncbi:hypothetical protein B0187_00555 [Haemophilus paracuniculus]|uniref:Uncharacterized protein n=1 Tax=Haemophilus paracuniculus TaxID=734 RepID=A0A1T0AVC4_9PAST|nr:hypothetical protein B0187_00555 [Haemophilus paracuniculus]